MVGSVTQTSVSLRLVILSFGWLATSSFADDWPKWNGPRGDGSYTESGSIQTVPASGLKKVWRADIHLGYAGPAVVGGRVIVADYEKESGTSTNNPGGRDKLTGKERVLCFDAKTGAQLWKHEYVRDYFLSYPSGPRATPTIDGTSVYVQGAEGDLTCLNVADGKLVWKRQLKEDYKTESPEWGYSAPPVIDGNRLYVLAGGEGSLVVALDKSTGNELWRSLSGSSIGYCPPKIIAIAGTEQLVVWEPKSLHGLEPSTGKVLWTYPLEPKYEMSIIPPVVSGDRMYASAIGDVAAMLKWKSDGTGVEALWTGKPKMALFAANSTPVFDGDYIYGADCQVGNMVCFRAEDGDRLWETFEPTCGGDRRQSHGTAFLTKTGDRFYLLSETGDFIIASMTPKAYQEIGRYHVIDTTNESFGRKVVWSYPAYANNHLFVRNDKEINCFSIKASDY